MSSLTNIYESRKTFKYIFLFSAILIAIGSVWVTTLLVNELKEEERKKIENWAEAIRIMSTSIPPENMDSDFLNEYDNLLLKLIQGNTTIPVILTDDSGHVIDNMNIHLPENNPDEYLAGKIKLFAKSHGPIVIELDENTRQYVYYDDSTVLKQLQLFPFILIIVLFIFIAVSFMALLSTQKAEQNKVWVGLSKETAHQLGTPISSLMAWIEYLKSKEIDQKWLDEMNKDVQRLKIIAERFSKIGSNPEPEPMNLKYAVENAVAYMGKRISAKVVISVQIPPDSTVMMNDSLFGWTIENLIKNAVDAMDGQGEIAINAQEKDRKIFLDIKDTGKGIPKSKFEAVFHPGYTTKKRGWGLGLSLVKRIVEEYSHGKIYVHKSEIGKGTTFRIELAKSNAPEVPIPRL